MKFPVAQALLLAGSAVAAPVVEAETSGSLLRRDLNARGLSDADILNFALTLEHLEATFYAQGLANYSQADFDAVKGLSPRLRFNIEEIAKDEATHVSFLTSALQAAGATPVQQCTYDFGVTDVLSFIKTAEILEGVGITAYLGAAAAIANPAYLTAAGSILTVEARHNAYLRNNQKPPMTPFPAPFDIPLDPNQVYTLASPFIVNCPSGSPSLPFMAFPSLTFGPKNPSPSRAGYNIGLRAAKPLPKEQLYCAWPYVTGPQFTTVYDVDMMGTRAKCQVPSLASGQTYVILTTSNTSLSDSNTVAGPAIVPVEATYVYGGFPM